MRFHRRLPAAGPELVEGQAKARDLRSREHDRRRRCRALHLNRRNADGRKAQLSRTVRYTEVKEPAAGLP